ncbi:DNA alkylation repair protein [Pontibacillus salipaludis]|uniref:DNA-7-methylguanine glycosylase n=1 Tax=Pontibacillus salipaludis TaxID=1697394 RepID=A0ABQ1PZM1_9BACI|nr:DNA alkylation repair protein [Pontibacillus salipaludis]GGD08412.1 hypothetical protein GCM10011389_14990 [Pontibacillus salipaludis]
MYSIETLQERMEDNQNEEKAQKMAQYMRNQFSFYGIQAEPLKRIVKEHIKQEGIPSPDEIHAVVKALWSKEEREYQMVALRLVDEYIKKYGIREQDAALIEYMTVHKSWWDTVDHIAGKHASRLFAEYPHLLQTVGKEWRGSTNIWLRRVMILFQLKYKEKTDLQLLEDIIRENTGSDEFFINKAIGWILREYSKTDAEWVQDFMDRNDALSKLSRREGLKYIKKHVN